MFTKTDDLLLYSLANWNSELTTFREKSTGRVILVRDYNPNTPIHWGMLDGEVWKPLYILTDGFEPVVDVEVFPTQCSMEEYWEIKCRLEALWTQCYYIDIDEGDGDIKSYFPLLNSP